MESVDEDNEDETPNEDAPTLRAKLEHLKCLVKQKDEENNSMADEHSNLKRQLREMEATLSSTSKKLSSEKSVNTALKKQMNFLKKQEIEVAEAKKEALFCKQELQRFSRLRILLESGKEEVDEMLNSIRYEAGATPEMITQLVILKKELEKMRQSKAKARQEKENSDREVTKLKHEISTKDVEIHKISEQLKLTESYLSRAEQENSSLKKKLSKLELAFNSPSPRSSAITRLMMESPAPMELKRPSKLGLNRGLYL